MYSGAELTAVGALSFVLLLAFSMALGTMISPKSVSYLRMFSCRTWRTGHHSCSRLEPGRCSGPCGNQRSGGIVRARNGNCLLLQRRSPVWRGGMRHDRRACPWDLLSSIQHRTLPQVACDSETIPGGEGPPSPPRQESAFLAEWDETVKRSMRIFDTSSR